MTCQRWLGLEDSNANSYDLFDMPVAMDGDSIDRGSAHGFATGR